MEGGAAARQASQGYLQPDVGGANIPTAEGELSDLAGDEPLFKALYQWCARACPPAPAAAVTAGCEHRRAARRARHRGTGAASGGRPAAELMQRSRHAGQLMQCHVHCIAERGLLKG
jgi:hypothetical protein